MTEKEQVDQITTIIKNHLAATSAPGRPEDNIDDYESLVRATMAYLGSGARDDAIRKIPAAAEFSPNDRGRLGAVFTTTFILGFDAGRRIADIERLECISHGGE